MRKLALLLVPFIIMASSLSKNIEDAIKKWDKRAYLSLFEKPEISSVKSVFLLKPIKVSVYQKEDILRISILRKPAPFLQTWKIRVANGKIVEKEVLNSLERVAYYGPEDSHCYVLNEAKIKLPDLEAKFVGGTLCQWPDSFIFSGIGVFRFRPSSFVERKNLLYLISQEQLEEKINFMFLRVQSKSGAQVKFSIGKEIKLPMEIRDIFEKNAPLVGYHFSPQFKTRVFRPVPEGGAFAVLGGKESYQYTFNPQSEKEIFISNVKNGRYLSFYTPSNKVVLILTQPKPQEIILDGEFDPMNNWIKAKAEIKFKEPMSKPVYFSLSRDLEIDNIVDERGEPLIFQKNSQMGYTVYPNLSFKSIIINYHGNVNKVDSYSNLWGGYFFPTLWYPYFGNYMNFRVKLKQKGTEGTLVLPGKKQGDYYVSEAPSSYIPLLVGHFRGKTEKDNLTVFWERRDLRAIRNTLDAYKKAKKIFGPANWSIKVGIRAGEYYFGSSSLGLINLEILKPVDRPIFSAIPIACGRRSIIVHEMFHQWIGGATKPYSLSDYWVTEGLTSLLTGMTICKKSFEGKYRKQFINDPIVVPLVLGGRIGYYNNSVKDIFKHLHYRSALVINMARIALGDKNFLEAVKEFVKKYQFKEFRWRNFTKLLEEKMGKPGFFKPWVYTYFIPEFSYSYTHGKLIIEERTPIEIEGKEYHFTIPVPVKIRGKKEIVWVEGRTEISVPTGKIKLLLKGLPARFYRK